MTVTIDLAGAPLGFDVPVSVLEEVVAAFDHARPCTNRRTPVMLYRQVESDGKRHFVRVDPARPPVDARIGGTVDDLVDDMHLTIALHSMTGVFVHAGVVGWNGTAILLPGRSFSGKSTLVEQLVRAGASYLSDEYAVVLPDGRIAPYPRPIQLRADGERMTIDPQVIGTVETGELPAALLLFSRFRERGRFDPLPLSPSAAALALFDNTVVAEANPSLALATAADLARRTQALRSDRPDASSVTHEVLGLAERARGAMRGH